MMIQNVQVGIVFPRSGQMLDVTLPSHLADRLKADPYSSPVKENGKTASVQSLAHSHHETATRSN